MTQSHLLSVILKSTMIWILFIWHLKVMDNTHIIDSPVCKLSVMKFLMAFINRIEMRKLKASEK